MDVACAYDWLQIPCVSDQANSIVTSVSATTGCASKLCGITGFTVTTDDVTATTALYSELLSALEIVQLMVTRTQGHDLTTEIYHYIITGYRRPFEVRFYTDSKEFLVTAAEAENWGFCLTYTQQPCLSTVTNG